MVENLLQPNKKLENLKPYYSRVRDYIKQPKKQDYIRKNSLKKKALLDDVFREIYDFHRIVRVSKDAARYKRYDIRLDKKEENNNFASR